VRFALSSAPQLLEVFLTLPILLVPQRNSTQPLREACGVAKDEAVSAGARRVVAVVLRHSL